MVFLFQPLIHHGSRRGLDDELIELLLRFKWWDKSIEEIDSLIPLLTCSDLEKVREELKARR